MAAANGLTVGPSEAEPFWTEYLRSLKARGLNGLKVVICDAPAGLKAAIRRVFNQPDQKGAVDVWRHVADQLRPRWPKLATLMDESEVDVLAYMAFPAQHRTRLHSTNPLERLNNKVKRRADVVGIFPNEDSILRLFGAVLCEKNDDWQSQHRCMMFEAFSQIDTAQIDSLPSTTTQAA